MKILIFLLITSPLLAQPELKQYGIVEYKVTSDSIIIKKLVTKVIVPKDGMSFKFTSPPDTARLFIPDDGFNYETTISFKKIVNVPEPPIGEPYSETYDATVADGFVFTGSWTVGPTAAPGWYLGTIAWSIAAGSEVTKTFVGNKLQVYSETLPTHGNIYLSIDGGQWTNTDLGLPVFTEGEILKSLVAPKDLPALIYDVEFPQGEHTFRMRVEGGRPGLIDYIHISGRR